MNVGTKQMVTLNVVITSSGVLWLLLKVTLVVLLIVAILAVVCKFRPSVLHSSGLIT